jgi:hypothetical protein
VDWEGLDMRDMKVLIWADSVEAEVEVVPPLLPITVVVAVGIALEPGMKVLEELVAEVVALTIVEPINPIPPEPY